VADREYELESLGPLTVKGRSDPVEAHLVLQRRTRARSVARRARLVGRDAEMESLWRSLEAQRRGVAAWASVCGAAGTGKSRLVSEFRDEATAHAVAWHEGRAFSYTQSIPYHLMTGLLGSAWGIEPEDSTESIEVKWREGAQALLGTESDLMPFIGSLFGFESPEIKGVDPETWRQSVDAAVIRILHRLCDAGPTVIHLEDVHWGDPASIALLRRIRHEEAVRSMFVYTFRPTPDLPLRSPPPARTTDTDIVLDELSRDESVEMLGSLLEASHVPEDVVRLLFARAQGNPFYTEELVSWLVQHGALTLEGETWRLVEDVAGMDVPPTIQGVIAARIDGLPTGSKTLLQQASVSGRRFRRAVLERIASEADIGERLTELEAQDLVRRVPGERGEWTFKHALTHDVAYEGLLRSERSVLHRKTGEVLEVLYPQRLNDLSEVLASHFDTGQVADKAVEYYLLSGQKAMARCALSEADGYYGRALELLGAAPSPDPDALVDLVNRWAYVYWYRQRNGELLSLLEAHRAAAEAAGDLRLRGMFESWLGLALWGRVRMQEAYDHLLTALHLGEESQDESVIGYACARLTIVCSDMGKLVEGAEYAERAMALTSGAVRDPELFSFARNYAGVIYFYLGRLNRVQSIADELLAYAERHSHVRSLCMGYFGQGLVHMTDGDEGAAAEWFEKSVSVSEDPLYALFPRLLLGAACTFVGKYDRAEESMRIVISRSREYEMDYFAHVARSYLGTALLAGGSMREGYRMILEGSDELRDSGCLTHHGVSEAMLGAIFAEMASGGEGMAVGDMLRNAGFLVRHVPGAAKKALEHLTRARDVFDMIESPHLSGWVSLTLGELHASRKAFDAARSALSTAIEQFGKCGIEVHRRDALRLLDSLPAEQR
jgi:tetratricopeptide (TPR) repeat protein